MYDVYSDFDLEQHIKHFINYLEVIIHQDGSVHYAVPSHQEYLINYGAKLRGISREEFLDLCPPEFYLDFLYWLAVETHCVIVWSQGYFGIDLTLPQKQVLTSFVDNNVMDDRILKV